jgi:hypothetical protein
MREAEEDLEGLELNVLNRYLFMLRVLKKVVEINVKGRSKGVLYLTKHCAM